MAARKKRVTRSSPKKADTVAILSRVLPDEIVKEILTHTPGVIIPHQHFVNTDRHSPFQDPTHVSTSTILAVCKQWLRVATPLIYHTVILRSRAQALALERALNEREENKILGSYIKWIRLEGHYGNVIADVLAASPNITDLCFTLTPWASESPYGMMDVLDQLNPVTLILYDTQWFRHDRKPGRRTVQFWEALQVQIPKWTSLKHVRLPSDYSGFNDERDLAFCKALSVTPNLETVHLHGAYSINYELLAENPSLKTIHIYGSRTPLFHPSRSDRIWSMLTYNGKTIKEIESERRQRKMRIPLKASEVFNDNVWKRIIEFYMIGFFDRIPQNKQAYAFPDTPLLKLRRRFLSVCKTFYRLGLGSFYEISVLDSAQRLVAFAGHLSARPELVKHVKYLIFKIGPYSADVCVLDSDNDSVQELFRQTRLLSLEDASLRPGCPGSSYSSRRCVKIPWKFFQIICDNSSSTLNEIRLAEVIQVPQDGAAFLSPFVNLTNLRTLCWHSSSQLNLDPSQVDPEMLLSLEELEYEDAVKTRDLGRSFLAALTCMKLPAIKSVSLKLAVRCTMGQGIKSDADPFLKSHGKKILSLHTSSLDSMLPPFKTCPNLTKLSVKIEGKRVDKVTFQNFFHLEVGKHSSLTHLVFELEHYQTRDRQDESSSFNYVYDPSSYRCFPNLQEIQMPQDCVWPTSQREIQSSGNIWPLRAERLLEGNIRLTDRDGKHWTPRLRIVLK